MRIVVLIVLFPVFVSCHSDRMRSVQINKEIRAEGEISPDTVYDGFIKFYNNSTNKLVESCYYRKGVKDSVDLLYNDNGTLMTKSLFSNGDQNGNTWIFDSSGNLSRINYFFHGLRCGNNLDYSNGNIISYWFYALDNRLLLHFIYDSIKGKKLGDLQPRFIYYTINPYQTPDENNVMHDREECFLYTPNPPKFDFRYSLVWVDASRKILSTVKEFEKAQPWVKFDVDAKEEANKKLALRLMIRDSINNMDMETVRFLYE